MTTFVLRAVRVFFATILCIIVFVALESFLQALLTGTPNPVGALAFGALFGAPAHLIFCTIPLLVISAIAEWKAMRHWSGYLIIWITITGMFAIWRSGSPGFFVTSISTIVAAVAAGFVYWYLAGRSAGIRPAFVTKTAQREKVFRYLAYAVVIIVAYQIAGTAWYGAQLLLVSAGYEPDRGTPAFQTTRRRFTAAEKVAMMNFPTVESCLTPVSASDSRERLTQMNWDVIDVSEEADICMFRLLASYGDISRASEWLEAQGFRSPDGQFNSTAPYKDTINGSKRVMAYWNIRENGPKIPRRGFIVRTFRRIHYSMGVDTTWSADGRTLLSVRSHYNTL